MAKLVWSGSLFRLLKCCGNYIIEVLVFNL